MLLIASYFLENHLAVIFQLWSNVGKTCSLSDLINSLSGCLVAQVNHEINYQRSKSQPVQVQTIEH